MANCHIADLLASASFANISDCQWFVVDDSRINLTCGAISVCRVPMGSDTRHDLARLNGDIQRVDRVKIRSS